MDKKTFLSKQHTHVHTEKPMCLNVYIHQIRDTNLNLEAGADGLHAQILFYWHIQAKQPSKYTLSIWSYITKSALSY